MNASSAPDDGFLQGLLNVNIVSGVVIGSFVAVSLLLGLFLVARRMTRRWLLTLVAALAGGTLLGALIVWLTEYVFSAFGAPLDRIVNAIVIVAVAACCVAIVNLWRSRWRRKVVAIVAVPIFLLTATLGINARFGLTPTVGAFLHISTYSELQLAAPTANAAAGAVLWKTWQPPAGMPTVGKSGTAEIPHPLSGFHSRPAGLYLPPAALVDHPPALPLVMMMMGQPGDPTPEIIAGVLDAFAAKHHGLAPIALVVDQLGDPLVDTYCADSKRFGKVQTFLTRDAVDWARKNLNIYQDPAHWTIAGYSNGGECAVTLGAKHPEIWGNTIDLSGEIYAGAERPGIALREAFDGDQVAFDREQPLAIMAAHHYEDSVGIYTSGGDDPTYIHAARTLYSAALLAGMHPVYHEVPGAGHGLDSITGGLTKAFEVLYPRLGLSKGAG